MSMELLTRLLSFTVLLSVLRVKESAGLGEACSDATPCADTTNHVCQITTGDNGICVVKANGVATGCTDPATNCPTNAACQTNTVCTCNSGYTAEDNGLCKAVIGMLCDNDAECRNALANTHCSILRPCTMGRCACDTGYTGITGQSCTVVPVPKAHGEACTPVDTCASTTTCTGGTCQCSTQSHTYKPSIQMCTDKALFTEQCTQVTDCYVTAAQNGACSAGVCTCAAGYTEDGMTCRAPTRDDACSQSNCAVSVDTRQFLPGESSSVTPTCSAGICSCGTGTSPYDREIMGTCYKFCLTDLVDPATAKANGETCSQFNECASKACYQCPEDSSAVCHSAECSIPSGSSSIEVVSIKVTLAVLFIVIHISS